MNVDLVTRSWLDLWNGDYDVAKSLVSDDIRVHAALADGGDGTAVSGRDGLVGWISQVRAAFSSLTFSIEVGPIVQNDHLAVRWIANGIYGGGFPGAAAPIGTPILFAGTDLLRADGDRLVEYWVNSDMHVLLAQLQVG
ncbi:ester cyclase [Umezawaea sp. NPDC059074]|uniref:ester cyclase n=1 Tax=Umezawaea sp. NPDC059074 TaxID=3346716 RepID=UPI0036864EAD